MEEKTKIEAMKSVEEGLEEIAKLGYGEIVIKVRSGKVNVIEKVAIIRRNKKKKVDTGRARGYN